ncbi:DUF6177 family protein [Amycolatopsis samaneae]|uniref:DUF6177 family protein n=1 Tax=Amycolatopsis samaneae TaxID=664691 RepID=A0ABW5GVK9_9PSEU
MTHPAADHATAEAVLVEQLRDVVPASTWLVDAARTAVDSGRDLQLLTAAHSRITYPLELLLRDAHADWVVPDGTGRHRDGLRGFPLVWNGNRFVPDADPGPAPTLDATPGSGDLEVQITVHHPAGEPPRLGTGTEDAMRALTGSGPTGWGVAEPATQPWSAGEITAHCRDRARPVKLVVVGHGVVGQLAVSPVDTGVIEEVRLSGPEAGTVPRERVEDLATACAGTARLLVVAAHPGRLAGLRAATPVPPALPYGVLIGHEMVAARGVGHARRTPAARVDLLGVGARTAVWCRFDGSETPPFAQFAEILDHFGEGGA